MTRRAVAAAAAAAACFATAVGIPVGFCLWYTAMTARHACAALEILTAAPVARPADAAANPSRLQLWRLYEGLDDWKRADGCPR